MTERVWARVLAVVVAKAAPRTGWSGFGSAYDDGPLPEAGLGFVRVEG